MSKYFRISGYWKDDKSEFADYVVREFNDACEDKELDDFIFFYGLSETDLQNSCKEDGLDFVVTSYTEIQESEI